MGEFVEKGGSCILELTCQDRYMVENAGWAARARAMQGLAEGNCKRLQSKINSLTAHEVSFHNIALQIEANFDRKTISP